MLHVKVNQNVAVSCHFLPSHFCFGSCDALFFSPGDLGEWTDPSAPSQDFGEWTDLGTAAHAATGAAAEDPTPPWRSQELPPPPKRPSSVSTVKVKRFRRAAPAPKAFLWMVGASLFFFGMGVKGEG